MSIDRSGATSCPTSSGRCPRQRARCEAAPHRCFSDCLWCALPLSVSCPRPQRRGLSPSSTNVSSPSIKLGEGFSDTAHVSSVEGSTGYLVTGTVTFSVYGPDDATCSSEPVFTSTNPVFSNFAFFNQASSVLFTPTQSGVYRVIATYSGDADNPPGSGVCNDPNEQVTVRAPNATMAPSALTFASVAFPAADRYDRSRAAGHRRQHRRRSTRDQRVHVPRRQPRRLPRQLAHLRPARRGRRDLHGQCEIHAASRRHAQRHVLACQQ